MQGAAHPDKLDHDKVSTFVEALTQFDRRLNQVVVDCGILKGIPKGRLNEAGNVPGGCLLPMSLCVCLFVV